MRAVRGLGLTWREKAREEYFPSFAGSGWNRWRQRALPWTSQSLRSEARERAYVELVGVWLDEGQVAA